MGAVLKKELKAYFLSPIGYVVIGIFLLFFSEFFREYIVSTGTVDLGYLYGATLAWGSIIIIPILTMRSFSEERKTGTEQLLFTSPTGMFKIVMGKFFAAVVTVCITLVISLIYYVILSFFGEPNIATTLVQMFGFVLVSMAAISFGLFASSLTENQVVAAITTVAFLLLNIFIDSQVLKLNLLNYYVNFEVGVISIEDIISLLLYIFVFISLTIIVLQRRKLVK